MSEFFFDSDCEMNYKTAKELNVHCIYMPYTINDKMRDYDLGEHTDFKAYYDAIRKGYKPTTQALNPNDYVNYFEPVFKQGKDILYVHFSNKLSGTFNYMDIALKELKEKYPERKFTGVDTLSISAGGGLIAYEAALLHNKGASDEEVVKWVEENRQHFSTLFTVDDLNHLKRGGRISPTTAFVGSVLNIKPLLKVDEEGKIVTDGKAVGRKKAINSLFEKMEKDGDNVTNFPIIVLNADCENDARYLEKLIKEKYGEKTEIWFEPIGPVIGCHCGPGTIGLIYHSKQR